MEKEGKKHCAFILDVLPLEIVYNILDQLTEKPLGRLRCVSKRCLTFVNEYVYTRFCHSITSANTNRLLVFWGVKNSGPNHDRRYGLHTYDLDSPKTSAVRIPLPMKYEVPSLSVNMSIIGSCNGIMCLVRNDKEGIILLNPTLMLFFELPKAPKYRKRATLEGYGFGYDGKKDDFKLVKFVSAVNTTTARIHTGMLVYSLKANSWRLASDGVGDGHRMSYNGVVIANHLLHWTIWHSGEQAPGIVCFDLCNEQWGELPLPDYLQGRRRVPSHRDILNLGNLDECLCLLTVRRRQIRESVVVWVMKEYGLKKSWVKLLSVSDKTVTQSLRVPPIAYNGGEEQEILLSKDGHPELEWYNLKDKSTRDAQVHATPWDNRFYICRKSNVLMMPARQTDLEGTEARR